MPKGIKGFQRNNDIGHRFSVEENKSIRHRKNISESLKKSDRFVKAMRDPVLRKKRSQRMKGDLNPSKRLDVRMKISESNRKRVRELGGNYRHGHSFLKDKVKERDFYTCQICGLRDEEIVEVDHIIPRCINKMVEYDMNNLQTICPNCHKRKTVREIKKYNYTK